MKRIAILISNVGKGSNLQAIVDAVNSKKINAKIVAVISDTNDAIGLKHAIRNKVPIKICANKKDLLQVLKRLKPDYIALAGWKQIILDEVIEFYPNQILNLHPGLIPNSVKSKVLAPDGTNTLWNRGLLAEKAVQNFLDKKSTYAGSSIHLLTKEFDFGPVLERAFEKIKKNDMVKTLYARLKNKEHEIYIKALQKLTNAISQDAAVLIIDGGGRAHALVDKYLQSKHVKRVIVIPGNDLMTLSKNVKTYPQIKTTDIKQIVDICKKENVDLVDVAQDDAIAAGLVDILVKSGFKVFGPTRASGQIEWDKSWSRNFMKKFKIPHPDFKICKSQKEGVEFINSQREGTWYIKAAGLAAGKGALYAGIKKEAVAKIGQMKDFGVAGTTYLIEKCLGGEEFSSFAIVNGKKFAIIGHAQDHKTVFDDNVGPNTGGMGCSSPPMVITAKIEEQIKSIFQKTVEGLVKVGRPYLGILYLGGIVDKSGKVFVIEFNARWGDPEAQVIVPSIKSDFFKLVNLALEGKIPTIKKDKLYRVVVTAASRGYPLDHSQVLGREIKGLKKLLKGKVKIFGAGVKKQNGKYIVSGGRLFYVLGEGKNVELARRVAYNALSQVSIDGDNLHFRKDIGLQDLQRLLSPQIKMIYTVRVASKNDTDPKGLDLLAEIKRTLRITSVKKIRTAKVYRLEGITGEQAKKFAEFVLVEEINQVASFDNKIFKGADYLVEVAYKLGVMNPEVASVLKSAIDTGIKVKAADSSCLYAFFGQISKSEIQTIIKRLLVNETIEHVVTKVPKTLIISGKSGEVQTISIRKLSDEQLMDLSQDRLFLNLEEMKVIQNYFKKIGRDPTDCEVEVLAQTWSEHCVHKTFRAQITVDGKIKKPFIERIKKTAKNNPKIIVSAFVDNSGVIDFYDGFAINGKVETHNSPSAIEPYGGAMTGSGGVFRDVLGTGEGAKPIASTDIFCFAPPDLPASEIPPGCLAPSYLLRRVVAGVRDYGNRVGIPTNNGSIHFHKDFRAKPTVAVGSFGILPKKYAKKGEPKIGDLVLTIGGATGRDGIHGATFSSGEMTHKTGVVSGSAVQIGNAIEEKRIIDAVLALRDQNLIRAITDCGAGGYSSAIGEMGAKIGARIYLEKVPLKYTGLAPWEIFLSESQERMVIATSVKNLEKVLKICKLYNVKVTVIGKFDGKKRLKVTYQPVGPQSGKQVVCDLDMQFLHHGLPQRQMFGRTVKAKIKEKLPKRPKDLEAIWQKVMAHGDVCSKEPIVRMYDHNVQGTNALYPFAGVHFDAPNDGAIIRPLLQKPYGLVVSHGLNPGLNRLDPYWGSIWAIAEAVSNYVSIGGDISDAALIDNFIWPFPNEASLADLDKSVDACFAMAKLLSMPFVSGKDSLSSTYRYPEGKILKIPPVLLISVFGKIADVAKTASSDFKKVGSTIVLVGKGDFDSMAGSAYFDVVGGSSAKIPKVDLKNLKKVFSRVTNGIKSGQILSAHDISEGGLAATLAEMCFGAGFGAKIDLSKVSRDDRSDYIFFNETAGTFLVEVANEKVAQNLFKNVPHAVIGKTISDQIIQVNQKGKTICATSVEKLKEAWQKPMKEIFH